MIEFVNSRRDMKKILCLHGFASSGSTGTATALRHYLYADYGVQVISPDIPIMPQAALVSLNALLDAEKPDLIIGTSMGAMYAETMKGYPRILVNPAFHMAKLISMKFRYLNKNVDFLNKREDGATSFKVDQTMLNEFNEIEKKLSLQKITPDEKKLVWGIFGKQDTVVNCQTDFTKAYGKDHFLVIEGEHGLTQDVIKKSVLPLILQILDLKR